MWRGRRGRRNLGSKVSPATVKSAIGWWPSKQGLSMDKREVTGDFDENDLSGITGSKPAQSGHSQTAEPIHTLEAVCCCWNAVCQEIGRRAVMMDGGREAMASSPAASHPMSKIWDSRQWEETTEGF